MKTNYSYYLSLVAIPIIAFVFLSLSGGRNGQYSGSPGDGGTTCTACHSGGDFGASAEITTTIPATGFVYGDTYEITVTATSSSSKHGFQLTTEDASQTKRGSYTAGTGNQIVNSGTHMTHTQSGNQQNSWTFDWTAPSFAEGGEVTFYAAVNATNGNGSTSGDQIVTTSATYAHSTVGVAENAMISFAIYPNPSSDFIKLDFDKSIINNATVSITDYNGKVVMTQQGNASQQIDISNLNTGVYIVQVRTETNTGSYRFIKK